MKKRSFKGIILSSKMEKTVIVKVERTVTHPKYGKRYTVSKHYPSDKGNLDLEIGDKVIIEECRPLSKTKRWRVIDKIKK